MKTRFLPWPALAVKRNVKARQEATPVLGPPGLLSHKHVSRVVVLTLALAGLTGLPGIVKTASAEPNYLYRTGFERSTFWPGDQLLGLDGWTTAIPPFLNPTAAKITSEAASHGRQSVMVRGADLSSSPIDPETGTLVTDPYDAVGSYRRPLGHEMSAAKPVARVEADLLLETAQAATSGEFFSLTIAARSGDGETLGEVGLSSQGIVEAFDFGVIPGSAPVFSQPILFNRWYHITMLLDFTKRTTSYFIDGQALGTIQAPSVSSSLLRAAMAVYARPDDGADGGPGSARSNYTARFDDFRVSVVPSSGN